MHSTFHGDLKWRSFDYLIWKENQLCYYQLQTERGRKMETSSHHQCQHLPDEQTFNFHTDVFVTCGFKESKIKSEIFQGEFYQDFDKMAQNSD